MKLPRATAATTRSSVTVTHASAAIAVLLAFGAGVVVSPALLRGIVPSARAESAPLLASVIDLAAIQHADLPTASPEMNARPLVVTDNATIAIQSGNIAKHIHPRTDEIQYIIEGSGSMWLGGERRDFKPGTLLVIPKGTAHAGTLVTSGPVKALAIKIPPQPKDDTVFVP